MKRSMIRRIAPILLIALMALPAALAAQDQTQDYAAVRSLLSDPARPAVERVAAIEGYLKKYPADRNSSYLVSSAVRLYAVELKQPQQAMAVARREMARSTDPDLLYNARQTYIYACGLAGDMTALHAFTDELRAAKALDGLMSSAIAAAAKGAREYAFALEQYDAALAEATPEKIATRLRGKADDKRVLDWLAWYRGKLLTDKAGCLVNSGRAAEAVPILQEAVDKGQRNILGLVNGEAPQYLGDALLQLGRYQEALPVLAADGIMGGNAASFAKLKQAYHAVYGSDSGFEAWVADQRNAMAKPAPDFTLPSPDGGSVSLAAFKGKVIMLDFWFPT